MPRKPDEERFKQNALGIKQVLQEIEDALIGQSFDEYIVATDHGSFIWRTVERAGEQTDSWSSGMS